MARQETLNAAADRIIAAAPSRSDAGLGGVVVDPALDSVQLFWHGALPAAVGRQIAAERKAGVTVVVAQAAYTQAELEIAAGELLRSTAGLARVAPKADGSGLSAKYSRDAVTTYGSRPALRSAFPVTVEAGTEKLVKTENRVNDAAPFNGGALLKTPFGFECSSGFTVVDRANKPYILTASHCGANHFYNGADKMVGATYLVDVDHDAQLLKPAGAAPAAAIWVGDSLMGTSQKLMPVGGSAASKVGNVVCASGAFSGAVCGAKVVAVGLSGDVEGETYSGLVLAQEPTGKAVAGDGDSGGPIFSLTTGAKKAIALGTLTGISSESADCQGVPADPGVRQCSATIVYPSIVAPMSALGFTVKAQ